MRIESIVLVLAAASPAFADGPFKVGNDYTLTNDGNKLNVTKGKQTVPLNDDQIVSAASVDLKAKKVEITFTKFCEFEDQKMTYTFDQLEARLVNAAALKLHLAKKWAEASTGFAKAAALDPKWQIPAYNLASAKNLLKDQAGAIAALAPWIAKEPLKTYVQVKSDPELASLLAAKELTALKATTPGTAKIGKIGNDNPYFYSSERGLVAYWMDYSDMAPCGQDRHVEFHDVKTGAEVARMQLQTFGDSSGMCRNDPTPTKSEQQKIDERIAKRAIPIEQVFADFGFAKIAVTESARLPRDDEKPKANLPKSKLYIVNSNVHRGNQVIGVGKIQPFSVDYLEPAKVMVFHNSNPNEGGCPNYASDVVPLK